MKIAYLHAIRDSYLKFISITQNWMNAYVFFYLMPFLSHERHLNRGLNIAQV